MMMMGAVVVFKSNLPLYSMYESGGDTTTMCGPHLKPVGVGRAEREKKSELHIPPLIWPKKDRCLKFFRKFQSGLGDYSFRASGSLRLFGIRIHGYGFMVF
jgi:hypothetical protein